MKWKMLIATACVAMACSAAVSAETTSENSTNTVTATTTIGNVDYTRYGEVQGEPADGETLDQTKMLAVNVGDTINIKVTGAGSDVTLLSYKYDEEANSDNIQYVDQYVATEGTVEITYKVRELTGKDGVYCLKINNGNDGSAETVYYKVGAPELVDADNNITKTYYKSVNFNEKGDINGEYANTTSVAYKATCKINGSIQEYGFTVTHGDKTAKSIVPVSGNITSEENAYFAFGVTIYGIPTEDVDKIHDIVATPIVNYNTTDNSVTAD